MTAYEKVKIARDQQRPTASAYFGLLLREVTVLHGDRNFGDDEAILGGIGLLGDIPVTFIGIERGTDLESRIRCNFGAPRPEGYRKALRLMKQAEKFRRPVICLVDTSGAYCGADAEERGQGQAIAENLMEMMGLKTPVISVIIGEGGSGGALGLAVADRVYMLENAVYSVISPEGCASILFKEQGAEAEAAECLHLTAQDNKKLRVAEDVIPEDFKRFHPMCASLRERLLGDIALLSAQSVEVLLNKRYARFRRLGIYEGGKSR